MKKRHFSHFHIAGFTYYDGALVFDQLKIGTKLKIKREKDNPYDARAVAIYYKGYKLGFIPRNENHEISKFLDQGYKKVFEMRINQVSPDEHPEQQIGVVLHLKHFDDLA